MLNHFDYSIGADNDEDIDPLQYYKVFNGNYPRVEMLAKHLLVIAGILQCHLNVYLATQA